MRDGFGLHHVFAQIVGYLWGRRVNRAGAERIAADSAAACPFLARRAATTCRTSSAGARR